MKNPLKTSASLVVLAVALGACASTPAPSPRLLAAEASLERAKADPATLESGRQALERADEALVAARDDFMRGRDNDYTHMIRMGEGYVELAQTRGTQRKANATIESLNRQRAEVISEAREREAATAEAIAADAELRADRADRVAAGALADSAASQAELTAEAARRMAAEARATALETELADFEQKQTAIGMTLILRDLQFASGSAVLISGAQVRLAPLAAFLTKQPQARIQIAGHTDAQGAETYNQDLSSRRAASVGAYLVSTGIDASRIDSIGFGESVPVSSNDTAAGRAINRRVEVTILD